MVHNAIDLTGKHFGKLAVIKRAGKNAFRQVQWLCQCECGLQKTIVGHSLRSGNTRSCGCDQHKGLAEHAQRIKRRNMETPEVDLDSIEQRLKNTTPGSWRHIEEDGIVETSQPEMREILVIGEDGTGGDMEFAAHAKKDIEDLLHAIRVRDRKIACMSAYIRGYELGRATRDDKHQT